MYFANLQPVHKNKGKMKLVQELHYEISSLDVILRFDLGVCTTVWQQTKLHQ